MTSVEPWRARRGGRDRRQRVVHRRPPGTDAGVVRPRFYDMHATPTALEFDRFHNIIAVRRVRLSRWCASSTSLSRNRLACIGGFGVGDQDIVANPAVGIDRGPARSATERLE